MLCRVDEERIGMTLRDVSLRRSFSVLLLSVVSACSGGGGHALPQATTQPASISQKSQVTLALTIPHSTATSADQRRPAYLSPATQSIRITVYQGGTPVYGPTLVPLTVSSGNCTSTTVSTSCTVNLGLTGGLSYTADFTTYDDPGGSGNVLSQTLGFAFSVVAGQANVTLPVVLGGIPASISITPTADSGYLDGNQTSGFTYYGSQTQNVVINALDARGNVIVGAGSPTMSFYSTNGTVAQTPNTSNTWTITPTVFISSSQFEGHGLSMGVTATPVSGSPLSITIPLAIRHRVIYFGQGLGSVQAAADGSGVPSFSYTTGIGWPTGLAVFGSTLYITANQNYNFGVYAPYGYTGSASQTVSGFGNIFSITTDVQGNVYTTDGTAGIYKTPVQSTTPALVYSLPNAFLVAVDSGPNLYVADTSRAYVKNVSNSKTWPTTHVDAIAIDRANTLYIADGTTIKVFKFTNASTTVPDYSITSPNVNSVVGMAADLTGRLYVANAGSATITSYAPGTSDETVELSGQPNLESIAVYPK